MYHSEWQKELIFHTCLIKVIHLKFVQDFNWNSLLMLSASEIKVTEKTQQQRLIRYKEIKLEFTLSASISLLSIILICRYVVVHFALSFAKITDFFPPLVTHKRTLSFFLSFRGVWTRSFINIIYWHLQIELKHLLNSIFLFRTLFSVADWGCSIFAVHFIDRCRLLQLWLLVVWLFT